MDVSKIHHFGPWVSWYICASCMGELSWGAVVQSGGVCWRCGEANSGTIIRHITRSRRKVYGARRWPWFWLREWEWESREQHLDKMDLEDPK